MEEKVEWRDIPNYEGIYQISKCLKLRSLDKKVQCRNATRIVKGKELILKVNINGYLVCDLWNNNKGKKLYVHRIIYELFVSKIPENMVINHKDGNKLNNNLNNLEICTHQDNMRHSVFVLGKHTRGTNHPSSVLTNELVLEIRKYAKVGKKSTEISKIMNLNRSTVLHVCNGKTYQNCQG